MTEEWLNRAEWKENVILVDADYVDKVAFDLTVNFERMIGRRIPKADMAQWLECVALDGGLRPQPSDLSLQTSFIHLPSYIKRLHGLPYSAHRSKMKII